MLSLRLPLAALRAPALGCLEGSLLDGWEPTHEWRSSDGDEALAECESIWLSTAVSAEGETGRSFVVEGTVCLELFVGVGVLPDWTNLFVDFSAAAVSLGRAFGLLWSLSGSVAPPPSSVPTSVV